MAGWRSGLTLPPGHPEPSSGIPTGPLPSHQFGLEPPRPGCKLHVARSPQGGLESCHLVHYVPQRAEGRVTHAPPGLPARAAAVELGRLQAEVVGTSSGSGGVSGRGRSALLPLRPGPDDDLGGTSTSSLSRYRPQQAGGGGGGEGPGGTRGRGRETAAALGTEEEGVLAKGRHAAIVGGGPYKGLTKEGIRGGWGRRWGLD